MVVVHLYGLQVLCLGFDIYWFFCFSYFPSVSFFIHAFLAVVSICFCSTIVAFMIWSAHITPFVMVLLLLYPALFCVYRHMYRHVRIVLSGSYHAYHDGITGKYLITYSYFFSPHIIFSFFYICSVTGSIHQAGLP